MTRKREIQGQFASTHTPRAPSESLTKGLQYVPIRESAPATKYRRSESAQLEFSRRSFPGNDKEVVKIDSPT